MGLDHNIASFPGAEDSLGTRLDHDRASSKSNTCSISYSSAQYRPLNC